MQNKLQYKIGDYVEFKYNGELKKGFVNNFCEEQIGKNISYCPAVFIIKTKSGKTYCVADGIIGDCFRVIRKLPILRDNNGRFTSKDKLDYSKYLKDWRDSLNKRMDEALFEKSCSCFNCDKCAEQMRAYYEKTGELKPSNVTKGPVKNSTGGGKTTETVTEDYMSTLEFGQMPYDSFGSRPESIDTPKIKDTAGKIRFHNGYVTTCWGDTCTTVPFDTPSPIKTEEKKPKERIAEIY